MKHSKIIGMEFREIYCNNCKKILGVYNTKFYNEDKIGELLKTSHAPHIKDGHSINIRKIVSG